MVLFLVGQSFVIDSFKEYSPFRGENIWSFGGPVMAEGMGESSGALLGQSFVSEDNDSLNLREVSVSEDSASAIGFSYPFSNIVPTRDGLNKYKVREGDTLSSIASSFGISLETIKLANSNLDSVISPGEEITILPVSGILYRIEEGDTLKSVASAYKVDTELIKKHNSNYQELFESPGSVIILPYAKPISSWNYLKEESSSLLDLGDYFRLPAKGWNWGSLHYKNGVDIAGPCGSEIYAAQEGVVREESSDDLWNEGYGNYLLIEHQNPEGLDPVFSKYAHTLKNFVGEGDYVLEGDLIALIGNTGNTHGPTGCHLHFEIHGAQNPFVAN